MSTDNDPRPLTRKELAAFLPNQRAIRAFERLFDIIPPDINDINDYLDTIRIQSVKVSVDYSVLNGNYLILVDASAAPVTITLPDVESAFLTYNDVISYFVIGISKIDTSSNVVTIVGQAGQTVVDETSQDLVLDSEIINVVAEPDSTNWELAS